MNDDDIERPYTEDTAAFNGKMLLGLVLIVVILDILR
jgi:hypothetical protein